MRRILLTLILVLSMTSILYGAEKSEPSQWFIKTISELQQTKMLEQSFYDDYHGYITRKDFAYLGVRLYESYTGLTATKGTETFIDTTDSWVLKAKHIGIITGYPDGTFRPNQFIRRDEIAYLFVNILRLSKATYLEGKKDLFTDDGQIQTWAKEAVYIAKENGLIGGVGGNRFNPSGKATREEALVLFYRGIKSTVIVPRKAMTIQDEAVLASFMKVVQKWPKVQEAYELGQLAKVVIDRDKDGISLTFFDNKGTITGNTANLFYFIWHLNDGKDKPFIMDGDYFLIDTLIEKGTITTEISNLISHSQLSSTNTGVVIRGVFQQSQYIKGVTVKGDEKNRPWRVDNSNGDLWFTTWSEDDQLYTSFGDGIGFIDKKSLFTDRGIGVVTGSPEQFSGINLYSDSVPKDEKEAYQINDKPSSLIYIDHQLIGHFHRPLEDPLVGYLGVSTDGGKSWDMALDSPWTKENESVFRCMMFLNEGQAGILNKDGYVYAYGIGKEWGWSGQVYLARVKKEAILDYSKYEYLGGFTVEAQEPIWLTDQHKAVPLDGLAAFQQFSAAYHPGSNRYISMTNQYVFDSPTPWGPWRVSGQWLITNWLGYQPGIISKYMEKNSFYFTIAGQPVYGDEVPYQLSTGKIELMTH